MSRLTADFGYVFDHASPIGEIVLGVADLLLASRRASAARPRTPGIRPEAGHNAIAAAARAIAAMRIGRLDHETTANVGRIEGGTAANVVAERCYVELEARSLDAERAGEVVTEMVDALTEAASDSECDVETSVERLFHGYRLAAHGGRRWRWRPRRSRTTRSSRPTSRPAAAATRTSSSRPGSRW